MSHSKGFAVVCSLLFSILFVSCGGGGGGTNTVLAQGPPAPNPTPAILTGFCSTITPGRNNFVFGLGNLQDSSCPAVGVEGMPMPSTGTLKNLQFVAELQGLVGATDTGTVTVLVNGTNTSLTCTASAVLATNVEAKCSDTQHAVTVNAGDQVAAVITMQTGGFSFACVALENR